MPNETKYVAPDGKVYNRKYDEATNRVTWELIEDSRIDDETQKKIDLLRMHNKQIQMKVTLLDDSYREIEEIVGRIKGYPSYEIDSESDIRRTCNITLVVPEKNRVDIDFENTWNKRMVELACAIYDPEHSEFSDNDGYVWFPLGTMLMVDGETFIGASNQEIKLNLVDLMAMLTPERGSQIGETYVLAAGDDPKQLISGIVAGNTPFGSTAVCEFEDTIPYDQTSNRGDYPIDVLKLIFDLFPYYEFFYDADGTFVTQQIPTKISDPIDIRKEVLDDLLISEKKTVDFSQIKNTTEIWGRSLSGDYIAQSCTSSSPAGTYNVIIDNNTFSELVSGEKYTIVPDANSINGQKMKIQNTEEYKIYTVNGAESVYTPIVAGAMLANRGYVIRYFDGKVGEETVDNETVDIIGGFILEGDLQIRVIVQEIIEEPSSEAKSAYKQDHSCNDVKWIVNPDSPFACTINPLTGLIQGEIKQVLEGGEYDGIYTTQLAYERATYENWLKCRRQDTVEIDTILIPWLDVNDKIEYTSPVTGEVGVWLVKSISFDFKNWTMTIGATRFYPYYPWDDVETT